MPQIPTTRKCCGRTYAIKRTVTKAFPHTEGTYTDRHSITARCSDKLSITELHRKQCTLLALSEAALF